MLKNVTITLSEEVARWARVRAAEENVSLSKLVSKILEAQMVRSDEYQEAHRRWQELTSRKSLRIDAGKRLTREQANARR